MSHAGLFGGKSGKGMVGGGNGAVGGVGGKGGAEWTGFGKGGGQGGVGKGGVVPPNGGGGGVGKGVGGGMGGPANGNGKGYGFGVGGGVGHGFGGGGFGSGSFGKGGAAGGMFGGMGGGFGKGNGNKGAVAGGMAAVWAAYGKGGCGIGGGGMGAGFVQGGWRCWACKAGPHPPNSEGCDACGKPKAAVVGVDGSLAFDGFWYNVEEWWEFMGKGGGKGGMGGGGCAGTVGGGKGFKGGAAGPGSGGGKGAVGGRWMVDGQGVSRWVEYGSAAEAFKGEKGGVGSGKGVGGGKGLGGVVVQRWKGRGGGEPACSEEDPWEVAGRNPEAKAKLLEARAAGVRVDYTPTPVVSNRFEALAEADEGPRVVELEEPKDPPGQPCSPFIVGKGGAVRAEGGNDVGASPFVENGGGFVAPNGGNGVGSLFDGADQVNFDAVVAGVDGGRGKSGNGNGGDAESAGAGPGGVVLEEWAALEGSFRDQMGVWVMDFLWKAGVSNLGALEDKLWAELGGPTAPPSTQTQCGIPAPRVHAQAKKPCMDGL